MKNIKVSVIVPIYNVELYLEECLNSIVNQNFDNYEVILVNDGSTDSSKEILLKFCNKYDYFKIINKKNEGLGAARNTGIEYINGEYVVFVDSDDYLMPNYLSQLYNLVSKDNCDIGICSHERYHDATGITELISLGVDTNKYYSNIEMMKLIFTRKIRCYAWDKIYKKDLFLRNNIRYLEGVLYEDIVATIKVVSISEKIAVLEKPLYRYRIRNGSISTIKSEKSIRDLNYSIDEVNKYLIQNKLYKYVINEIINFNISYTLGSIDMLCRSINYSTKIFYNMYNEFFKDAYLNYSINEVILNKSIDKWVKRDYILLKLRLLPIKNRFKDWNINV